MAATMAKDQYVQPVKDTDEPEEQHEALWDQIEAKYWQQIRIVNKNKDRKLEEEYRAEAEKLQADKVRRHEESVLIVKKIQELRDRLQVLAQEDAVADTARLELDKTYEAKRAAERKYREEEAAKKKELFETHRRSRNRPRSAIPIASTTTTLETTTRLAPLADRPPQNINIIPSKSPVAETAEKQIQVVKEVKVVQVVETQAKAVVDVPARPLPVDKPERGTAMDLDTAEVFEKPADDQQKTSMVPQGSDGHQDTPALNGTQTELPQEPRNGVAAQSENNIQESIETEKDGQNDTMAHSDQGGQNEATAQGDMENQPVQGGPTTHQSDQNDQTSQVEPVAEEVKEAQDSSADTKDAMQAETQNATPAAPNGLNTPTDAETCPPQQVAHDPMEVDEEGGGDFMDGATQRTRLDTESSSELTSAHSTPLASPIEEHFKGVDVYDGSGQLVGTVRHINLENRWVDHVKTLPIKRSVEIRPGRKFSAENLESIYEPSDAKGAKWLSCYIQATGEVQGQACHKCTENVGVFSQCVILGVDGFPRCGNCEWNRQGCYGASLLPKSRQNMAESESGESPSRPKATKPPPLVTTGGFTPVNNSASGQKARSPEEEQQPPRKALAKSGRKSLPSGSKQKPQPQAEMPLATTPLSGSPAHESRDGGSEDLEEITKSVLEFEDDGKVFTKPDFMAGVPLEKISADHPYWDKDWAPLEPLITSTLRKWEGKLEHHKQVESAAASKFLANRQVNRGNSILEFLRDGELHPYQLVGKRYITKALGSYDTVFRLVQVLGELRKFQIDVTPTQWLRHRLYEVWKENPDGFLLSKTVHNLYHDPKVSAIRAKSGFGNIGRPSGYRMEKDEQPKRASRAGKRKEPHATPNKSTPQQQRRKSASETKAEEPVGEPAQEPAEEAAQEPAQEPAKEPAKESAKEPAKEPEQAAVTIAAPTTPTHNHNTSVLPRSSHRKSRGLSEEARVGQGSPRQSKKQRLRAEPDVEDLVYDGYTSSDSFSNDHVMQVDWRVHQVKHAKISTNTNVTQYWHYVDEDGHLFEHQVLKDVMPTRVAWGVYKEPYDFHLRLAEITEATFARGSKHVIIGTKEVPNVVFRGDLMVAFKRDRTKRRFLTFLRKRGIKLVRTTEEYVEKAWKEMDPDVLPHYDSDG